MLVYHAMLGDCYNSETRGDIKLFTEHMDYLIILQLFEASFLIAHGSSVLQEKGVGYFTFQLRKKRN